MEMENFKKQIYPHQIWRLVAPTGTYQRKLDSKNIMLGYHSSEAKIQEQILFQCIV